jgi:hypothetical protein
MFQSSRQCLNLKLAVQQRQQINARWQLRNEVQMIVIQPSGAGTVMHRKGRHQMQLAGLENKFASVMGHARPSIED